VVWSLGLAIRVTDEPKAGWKFSYFIYIYCALLCFRTFLILIFFFIFSIFEYILKFKKLIYEIGYLR